jgi:hypothetical protein
MPSVANFPNVVGEISKWLQHSATETRPFFI